MLHLQNRLLRLLYNGSAPPLLTITITSLHRRFSATASTSPFAVEDYLFTTKSDVVLSFLSGLGLSSSDIAAVVSADPKLLCSNVDKTLAPRVASLRDLGLSPPQIARFVLIGAPLLRFRDVASRLRFWIPLFGSFDEFIHAVSRGALGGAAILRLDIDTVVKPNIDLLRRCGLSVHDLAKTGISGAWAIPSSPNKLKVLVARAEQLGVQRRSGQFKYALATVSCLSQEKIASRVKLLKKTLGCSHDLLQIAIVKHPSFLRASKDNLRSTAEFLVTKVGLEPEYIVRRPALISYSLKARLVPRYIIMTVLQGKGLLSCDYCSIFAASECYFFSRFIDHYKETVPELANVYSCRGNTLSPPTLTWFYFLRILKLHIFFHGHSYSHSTSVASLSSLDLVL